MDDHEILQHLLSLENEAAALVDDAQAEADRRVSEGEKLNRSRYDETYAHEVEALEVSYIQKIAAVKEGYRKQLEEYGNNLRAMPSNPEAFSSLAEELLFSNNVDSAAAPGGKL